MHNPRQFIEVRGEKREILLTPSLYKVAKELGVSVTATEDMASIQSAYIKLIYLGIINARQVAQFKNPALPDTDVDLADVEIYAMQHPKEFGRLIVVAAEVLSGETIKKTVEEKQEKKKSLFRLFRITKK